MFCVSRDFEKEFLFVNPRPFSVFRHLRQWRGGGGGGYDPPGDWPLIVVELRGKEQLMRLDEISLLHILFLVLGQHLTSLGQIKDKIFAKNKFLALHAHSSVNMCRIDLKPLPACSLFNS